MAAVVDRVADVLSALLALKPRAVPDVLVSRGWAVGDAPWQALDRAALENLIVGGPLSRDSGDGDSLAFTIHIDGVADPAWLMIIEQTRDDDPSPQILGDAHPARTCVGVVLAIAVVLAIGIASNGKLGEDWQIPMTDFVDDLLDEPERFIELTRMPVSGGPADEGLPARCERFLRRFPRLGGWPREVRLSGRNK